MFNGSQAVEQVACGLWRGAWNRLATVVAKGKRSEASKLVGRVTQLCAKPELDGMPLVMRERSRPRTSCANGSIFNAPLRPDRRSELEAADQKERRAPNTAARAGSLLPLPNFLDLQSLFESYRRQPVPIC